MQVVNFVTTHTHLVFEIQKIPSDVFVLIEIFGTKNG